MITEPFEIRIFSQNFARKFLYLYRILHKNDNKLKYINFKLEYYHDIFVIL